MLHLSSTELSMIRVSIRTRISVIESGLFGAFLFDDEDKKELIERYDRLMSKLDNFCSKKADNSQVVLIESLNLLGHENREN